MKRYGLIGYPLTHSFSSRYFTAKFRRERILDSVYGNYPLESIDRLPELLNRHDDWCGLNVTIPYKESVLAFVDELDPLVEETGACNCIAFRNKRMVAHNTDIPGFRLSLQDVLSEIPTSALVLGTGGAAKAVTFVLSKMNIPWRLVSRSGGEGRLSYAELTAEVVSASKLIVNTTPLGMFPHTEQCPPIPYEAVGPEHLLFDLIYNPARTRFLQEGESRGARVQNGEEMLRLQAEESWIIWNR